MKITRKQLRKIIQEAYQMSAEDKKALIARQIVNCSRFAIIIIKSFN